MKKIISLTFFLVLSVSMMAQIDKIVGRWKTIDDNDGTAKSIVYIFKATNGKYYGKIEKLFQHPDKLCTECQGANKNKPELGLIIINNMMEKDGKLAGGTILDPANGKVYHCHIYLNSNDPNKLEVRGSLDSMGWLGRSQTWLRVS